MVNRLEHAVSCRTGRFTLLPRKAYRTCEAPEGVHLPRNCCHGSCLLCGGLVHEEAVHKAALGVLVQVHSVANTQLRLQEQTARTGTSRRRCPTPLQKESA